MRALSRSAGGIGTFVGRLMIRLVGKRHSVRAARSDVGIAVSGFIDDVAAESGIVVIWRN